MYKLAIFDLDGTILNTIDDLADSCNFLCEKQGYPTHSVDEYKRFVGNGIPKLIERALPCGIEEGTRKAFYEEYVKYYQQHCAVKTAPYEGMCEALTKLKEAGVLLAVNTNKLQKAAEDLCAKYFPGFFEIVCGGGEGIPPKPDCYGVKKIFAKVGILPEEAAGKVVFIGDSDVDINTGKNAGIDAIGVDWGFRGEKFLREKGAEIVVKKPLELVNLILSR